MLSGRCSGLASPACRIAQRLSTQRPRPRSWRRRAATCAAVEFVPYTPIQKGEVYDLRLLQPHAVASTSYQRRDAGFLTLGGYLSGGNAAEVRGGGGSGEVGPDRTQAPRY